MTPPPVVAIIISEIRGGRYSAQLEDGTELCRSTRQPLLDGARELPRRGYDPATSIVMRREGSSIEALSSTVGAVAKLTVEESNYARPRFTQWKPFERPEDAAGSGRETPAGVAADGAKRSGSAGVAPMPENACAETRKSPWTECRPPGAGNMRPPFQRRVGVQRDDCHTR